MDDTLTYDLDIDKMFDIHYKLSEIFESENNILNIELPVESDNGFIEYKRNLSSYESKLFKLKTQIYWRMSEGLRFNSSSHCYYIVGIEDNGNILEQITEDEMTKTLTIVKNCIDKSNIKSVYKNIIYKNNPLLIFKFWKDDTIKTNDIRVILIGASESNKTNFFVGLHNYKFNVSDSEKQIKLNHKIFKSDIFDIHSNETKTKKTLILHHQYLNINKNFKEKLELTDNEDEINIHIIDTSGNSIISNIKYLMSYNVDIIIHFNQSSNLYNNILDVINSKYNNVLNITDTTYMTELNPKKLLFQALQKYQPENKILNNIENIVLVNESRIIKSYQETIYNKHIFYCYNLMNINIFDKISDIYIRNIQYNYNYKSSIESNNSISIETNKTIHKIVLGNTQILESLDIPDLNLETSEYITTYYLIILNQIYLVNCKNLPEKIFFSKIILIPEKFEKIPIFIIWNKNNEYFIKIFDYFFNHFEKL